MGNALSCFLPTINSYRLTTFVAVELTISILVAIFCLFIPAKSSELKWIKIYCLFNAFADLLIDVLALNGINNILIIELFIGFEVFILLNFFSTISNVIFKILKLQNYLLIYLVYFVIIIFYNKPFTLNPFALIYEGILVFTCCIIYFLEELKSPTVPFLYEEPSFWFGAGFLIYYGGTWIIHLGIQYFVVDPKMFVYIWEGQNILSILKYIIIAIGLICSKRN